MSTPTTPPYANQGKIERIYVTYKTRIASENRMKLMALWSQIVVAWYSVWITAVSLADISDRYTVQDGGVVTTFLSIAILTASIFLYGQRFEIRAAGFRECYLKLRNLYDSTEHPDIKISRYNEILLSYENHSEFDYKQILFDSWFYDKAIHDADGQILVPRAVIVRHVIGIITRVMFLTALLVIPIIIVFYTVSPSSKDAACSLSLTF